MAATKMGLGRSAASIRKSASRQCFCRWLTAKKFHARKNRRSAAASAAEKWYRENLVTQAWPVRKGIAAGIPSVAYVRRNRQYCVPSEHRRRLFCASWPWSLTFWPHGKRFSRLIVEYLCFMFGDTSCVGFWDIMWINKQTDNICWKPYPCDQVRNMCSGYQSVTALSVSNSTIRIGS